MSRRTWSIASVGVALVGTVAAFGAAGAPSSEASLADEVKSLRTQVEQLENRLKALESAAPRITATLPPKGQFQPLLPEAMGPNRVQLAVPADLPPGTVQREFNGMTYYVMPIRESADSPSR